MKAKWIIGFVLVGLLATGAAATPITAISALTVPTSFEPTGGDFGIGVLTLDGIQPLYIDYEGQPDPTTLPDCSFYLVTSLEGDYSTGGQVLGLFLGGDLVLKDSSDTVLLDGTMQSLTLMEIGDNVGVLSGSGVFTVEGGTLMPDFGTVGNSHEIIFNVVPETLESLGVPFTGDGNISLNPDAGQQQPIPEPAVVCLLAMGLAGLVLKRKR